MTNDRYHTDPAKWTCSCLKFINSRFLVCKYILACYEPITQRGNFFNNVARSRTSPFWVHPQLVLRPEFRQIENQGRDTVSSDGDGSEVSDDSEDDASSIDSAAVDEDRLADLDEDPDEDADDKLEEDLNTFESDLLQGLDILQDQRVKGNRRFLERYMSTAQPFLKQVREIVARNNQHTMHQTWGQLTKCPRASDHTLPARRIITTDPLELDFVLYYSLPVRDLPPLFL